MGKPSACQMRRWLKSAREGELETATAKSALVEANLRGHLKIEGADGAAEASEEESGSSSYVAPQKDKDTQLKYALGLLRASKTVGTDPQSKT